MGTIVPFLTHDEQHLFDDTLTRLMGAAFDAAVHQLHDLHDKGQPQIVREVIARRIVAAARRGERDVSRLREAGLGAIKRSKS